MRAVVPQWADESGGLGVVEHGHVAGAHRPQQVAALGAEGGVVGGPFGWAQWATVARCTVQSVVEAFGEVEEGLVALHHQPGHVDPRARHVGEEAAEHLCDPSAGGGRVDVPQPSMRESLAQQVKCIVEPSPLLGFEDVAEPVGRPGDEGHRAHGDGASRSALVENRPPPGVCDPPKWGRRLGCTG